MANSLGNTQDLVEVDHIQDGVVVLKDGSLRQIIMVGGINFSLKSEQEQNLITRAYQDFLNGLSFPIQIVIHSRKINIERYLNKLEEHKNGETSGLLQDQISEYQAFVRQFVSDHAIMEKTFFAVVSYHPVSLPMPSAGALSFLPFLKRKPGEQAADAAKKAALLKENLTQLSQRVNQVREGLNSIGLESLVLNDEQLTELFYNFYNPETVEKEGALNKPHA